MTATAAPPLSRTRRTPSPTLVLSLLVVAFFLAAAIVPGALATHDPLQFDLAAALQGPSLSHLAGTDEAGRDLYSRIIFGTRESLSIGLGATALSLAIALVLGVTAGLGGRLIDAIVSRGLDVLFAFPMLLVALLFVAAFGPSPATLVLAVGIGTAPGYARMIRGQVLAVRTSPYVEAAHAVGHSSWRVLRQHIVPNAVRPLVAVATLSVGQSIVWASGLSFLGLGVAPPSPEWGALLDAGRAYMTHAWWLEVLPGLAIVLLALAVTTIGRHLQQHLEGHRA
ncbi:ABC transporter permease [Salinibacterium sp. dk2585]|uniref:ABC transporter permease n=1 Tax=unclassified Salinibacterium TaxID=2632331 RepID=UPI0011C25355|nr:MULTISPECIES: ABC transporter permease [unclassified Salinibacterium]QEE61082.1 ABC transporter permease [Salinibacterium sp. dk2585]TXK53024.1 ABC transporter permease [Salinibacterium sp. dk5596]